LVAGNLELAELHQELEDVLTGQGRGPRMNTRRDRFRLIYELGNAFAACSELNELLPVVLTKCCAALEAESVAILLLDSERNELYFPFVSGGELKADTRLGAFGFQLIMASQRRCYEAGCPKRSTMSSPTPAGIREWIAGRALLLNRCWPAPRPCVCDWGCADGSRSNIS